MPMVALEKTSLRELSLLCTNKRDREKERERERERKTAASSNER